MIRVTNFPSVVCTPNPDGGLTNMASSGTLLVAAIDIGTAFSGYAFSFRRDYEFNPLKVHFNVHIDIDQTFYNNSLLMIISGTND